MQQIREFRLKAGLLQADVASAMGVTQSTVSQWESGQTFPASSKLTKLAELLKCSVSDLLDNTDTADAV